MWFKSIFTSPDAASVFMYEVLSRSVSPPSVWRDGPDSQSPGHEAAVSAVPQHPQVRRARREQHILTSRVYLCKVMKDGIFSLLKEQFSSWWYTFRWSVVVRRTVLETWFKTSEVSMQLVCCDHSLQVEWRRYRLNFTLWTDCSFTSVKVASVCCRYCAGTMPWGHPSEHQDFEPQRHDDGCIEVIGFTMTSLVSSQL